MTFYRQSIVALLAAGTAVETSWRSQFEQQNVAD
jgi:hypothetical protein